MVSPGPEGKVLWLKAKTVAASAREETPTTNHLIFAHSFTHKSPQFSSFHFIFSLFSTFKPSETTEQDEEKLVSPFEGDFSNSFNSVEKNHADRYGVTKAKRIESVSFLGRKDNNFAFH